MLYEAPDDSVLKRIGDQQDEEPLKQVLINQQIITSSNLSDFVTSTSKVLFQKLKLISGFRQKDPDTWNDENDFLWASSVEQELKVVNDHAERAVNNSSSFNLILFRNNKKKFSDRKRTLKQQLLKIRTLNIVKKTTYYCCCCS